MAHPLLQISKIIVIIVQTLTLSCQRKMIFFQEMGQVVFKHSMFLLDGCFKSYVKLQIVWMLAIFFAFHFFWGVYFTHTIHETIFRCHFLLGTRRN